MCLSKCLPRLTLTPVVLFLQNTPRAQPEYALATTHHMLVVETSTRISCSSSICFFCDDVLMRDTASATEEVQQTCARSRTTVTREIRVALQTDPRRAHRAPAHQPRHASPIPAQPTACQVGSARQRPSFGFLPSLSFLSAPLRLCTTPPSREPFHPLCGVESAPPAEPKIARLRQRVRAGNLGVCGSLLSRFALEDHQLPGQPAPLPLHSGRHVAPASEFHAGVKLTRNFANHPKREALAL